MSRRKGRWVVQEYDDEYGQWADTELEITDTASGLKLLKALKLPGRYRVAIITADKIITTDTITTVTLTDYEPEAFEVESEASDEL